MGVESTFKVWMYCTSATRVALKTVLGQVETRARNRRTPPYILYEPHCTLSMFKLRRPALRRIGEPERESVCVWGGSMMYHDRECKD